MVPSRGRTEKVPGTWIETEEILDQLEHMVIWKGSVIPGSVAATARTGITQDIHMDQEAGALEDAVVTEAEDRMSQGILSSMDLG